MHNEAYSLALKNALTEIKNICPDVHTSFLFDKQGTIIAGDNDSTEAPFGKAVDALEGIFDKKETMGDLDMLIVNGQRGKMQISCVNDMYLAMIMAKNADMAYVQTVSRVLVPTVIKLLDSIIATPARPNFPTSKPSFSNLPKKVQAEEIIEDDNEEEVEEASEEKMDEETIDEEDLTPKRFEPSQSQKTSDPENQLIVDTLSGLLVRGDTVQIDSQILDQWSEYYDGVEITEVEIESFNGNSTQCKVKPIKDSKIEGKGIIRIPERACQDLDVRKGELVKVKPLFEEE